MSVCGLSCGKLKLFDEASGNAKIRVLDISYNKNLPVNAICQLTLKVTDRLIARRSWPGVWSEQDIRELQDFIHAHHPGGLKVTVGDSLPELRSEITSEEYLSKSKVIDYLRRHRLRNKADGSSSDSSASFEAGKVPGYKSRHDSSYGTSASCDEFSYSAPRSKKRHRRVKKRAKSGVMKQTEATNVTESVFGKNTDKKHPKDEEMSPSMPENESTESKDIYYGDYDFVATNIATNISDNTRVSESLDPDNDKPCTSASLDSKSKELSATIAIGNLHVIGDLNQEYISEDHRGATDQSFNKGHLEFSDKRTPHSELGVLIPREIGNLVDEDSLYSTEDSGLISSAEEEQSMESVIPTETITATIGKASKTIEVGGCFVRFEAGSFDNPQEVTIKAEIDPSKWPPGREAVTPRLYISAKHLQREATVELHTWCEVEGANIDVMCYTKQETEWRVIKTCSVDESRFIKFKLRHFCSIVATVRRWLSWAYVIKPVIYYSKRNFVIALLRDTELSKKSLKEDMASKFGVDLKNEPFSPFECSKRNVITSSIKCVPEEGFQFLPSNHHCYIINEVVGRSGALYRSYTLDSRQPTASINILIEFKNDDQVIRDGCFAYDWMSGDKDNRRRQKQRSRYANDEGDKPCTSSSMKGRLTSPSKIEHHSQFSSGSDIFFSDHTSGSEDSPSQLKPASSFQGQRKQSKSLRSKPLNLNVKGNVHVDGDFYLQSTGRSEKYKDVNAQTLNRGRLRSKNKNTSNVMKVSKKADNQTHDSESES